jgi:hypothetical protein
MDPQESMLCHLRFVARTLHVLASEPISFGVACVHLRLYCQSGFHRERSNGVDQELADGSVECSTADHLADRLLALDPFAFTSIVRDQPIVPMVVADRHPFAAASADDQTL